MKFQIEKLERSANWSLLADLSAWVLQQALQIQRIPAPTFNEGQRAAYVAEQFAALGLDNIEVDDLYNAYGRLPGTDSTRPALMLVAHTDTVFPAETDLTTRSESGGAIIHGPGLGDNSMGVAGVLGVAEYLRRTRMTLGADLWFVAPSREEGLGDLDGMKAAFERLRGRVKAVINVEGLAFGHIYHAGIAVRRLHIVAQTEGGHSWLHFGRPSAIHAICQLGARIAALTPPTTPRTTFNIGLIEGGQSINTIATEAALWLDLRSESPPQLEALEREVHAQIDALSSDDLRFTVKVVGDRPAGTLPADHDLVKGALAALEQVGLRGSLETGSTDGNVPLAAGCPAVTVGVTRGGNAHRLDEYVETGPISAGLKQLILLTLAAADTVFIA
jgi:acetylornithine deacetylase/succinyl-diaminopimelate desuccinylase-like protein